MSFSGWYAFDNAEQAGISFGGNQAIVFGRDHANQQVWLNLVDEGVRYAAFRPDGNGGMEPVGSVKITRVDDLHIEVESALQPDKLGDPGFSPPPPRLFNGRATLILFHDPL
jgi:hypothetical protein